jgi:hypothetical protein
MIVRIGAIDYAVVEEPDPRDASGKPLFGQIDYERALIRVKSGLCRQQRDLTLWHEMMHGLHNMLSVSEPCEEDIDRLAVGMIQLLRDNPQLYERFKRNPKRVKPNQLQRNRRR